MIIISATFTALSLQSYLEFFLKNLDLNEEVVFSSYNQIFQDLLNENGRFIKRETGINIVLLRIQDLLPASNINIDPSHLQLKENIKDLLVALTNYNAKTSLPLIFCICPSSDTFYSDEGLLNIENELCTELKNLFGTKGSIYPCTYHDINQLYPTKIIHDEFSEKLASIPYVQEYFFILATFLSRKLHSVLRSPYKVLFLDCDETLWKGVCGEVGWMNIEINSEHLEFQKKIIALQQNGVLICLCSKNNEEDVFDVFANRPDMLLKQQHLTAWRINWKNKSENLKSLSDEINIKLDDCIFIDDNPIECAEVQSIYPGLLVANIPKESKKLKAFLNNFWVFDSTKVTQEDQHRVKTYKQNIEREKLKNTSSSFLDFIKNLNLNITISELTSSHIQRAAQLTQRTNQFNLTTQRFTEQEILNLKSREINTQIIEVSDRFGDYGLVGLIFYKITPTEIEVINFCLSCRVLGKGVEHNIISKLGFFAENNNIHQIKLHFLPSAKNQPALDFLNKLNCDKHESSTEIYYLLPVDKAKTTSFSLEKHDVVTTNNQVTSHNARSYNSFLIDLALNKTSADIFSLIDKNTQSLEKILPDKIKQGSIEDKLIEIFGNTLKVGSFDINSSFLELGGDSLSATLALSRIWKEFNVELSLTDIFEASAIFSLKEKIEGRINLSIPIEHSITASEKNESKCEIDLSSAQKRLWFLEQMFPGQGLYNMPIALLVKGSLNIDLLENSIIELIKRHDSFRTYFVLNHAEPKQIVLNQNGANFKIKVVDAQNLSDDEITHIIHSESNAPFDLASPPLLRTTVLIKNDSEYIVIFCFHHIIHDGWSFNIFSHELSNIYNAAFTKNEINLSTPSFGYKKYTLWHNKFLRSPTIDTQITYWKNKLVDLSDINLPVESHEIADNSHSGKHISFRIPNDILSSIKEIAKNSHTTIFTILLSVFCYLISRYSNQDDIAIGVPTTGRHYPDTENIIGFFVNLLVMRFNFGNDLTFNELFSQAKLITEEAFNNQDVPFEKVVEMLKPSRNSSTNPLVRIIFAFQNYSFEPIAFKDTVTQRMLAENQNMLLSGYDSTKFDISLFLQENKNGYLDGLIEYNIKLFHCDFINNFINCFLSVLSKIKNNLSKNINTISLTEENSSKYNLFGIKHLTSNKSITDLFVETANKFNNTTAVVYKDSKLTYDEVNIKSNKIANYLKKMNVTSETIVAVYLKRNIDLPSLILGIWKCGGVYLPISQGNPHARTLDIIRDSNPSVLITENSLFETLNLPIEHKINIVLVDYLDKKLVFEDASPPVVTTDINSLAYIIYTSGSTGRPKGIALEQKTLINLIEWQHNSLATHTISKITQYADQSFDVSLQEICYALLTGKTLYIPDEATKLELDLFINNLDSNNIDLVFIPTALLDPFCLHASAISPKLQHLVKIVVSGEKLIITKPIKKFFSTYNHVSLCNQYGPSESHVVSEYILDGSPENWPLYPPIGKPITNTGLYVLDRNMAEVPQGAIGELYLTGPGLARCYLNNPSLTSAKFLPNTLNDDSKTIYKTGDLARWNSKGELEYLGRTDEQVKIRGFRVELDEIQAKLMQNPNISQAIVLLSNDNQLVAHITLTNNNSIENILELNDSLKDFLPSYMLPQVYLCHDSFKLTRNGKIDKKYLNEYYLNNKTNKSFSKFDSNNFTISQNILINIFSELLNIDKNIIGLESDFFELGGHSLLVMKLVSQIQIKFGLLMYVKDIFQNSTIKSLSHFIDIEIKNNLALENKEYSEDLSNNIILLNKITTRPPLFLIHPISGTVFCYSTLAAFLDGKITVYAIQDPSIESKKFMFGSIEQMAECYVNLIVASGYFGPCYVGGYSFGGLVAAEVTKKLLEKGYDVKKIILLDSWVLSSRTDQERQKLNETIKLHQKDILDSKIDDDQLKDHMAKLYSQRLYEIGFKYKPPVLPCPIVLLKATHSSDIFNEITNQTNSWDAHSTHAVETYPISGNHETILSAENMPALAQTIEQLLDN